jgi:20S proteasome alpha/beta subunit
LPEVQPLTWRHKPYALSNQNSAGVAVWQDYEELPVTLQVGLIGSDGWLIASDTRESRDTGGMQLSSNTGKIHDNDTFVLSFSGDEWSRRMRDEIVHELTNVSGINDQRAIVGKSRVGIWNQIPESARFRTARTLLFGSKDDPGHLYEVSLGAKNELTQKWNFVTAGDLRNPAQFFIQHYYIKRAKTKNPVDQLKLLAAHTIIQAGRHNERVEGLEMVVCRATADDHIYCERVPDSEIERLTAESKAIDEQLVKLFEIL